MFAIIVLPSALASLDNEKDIVVPEKGNAPVEFAQKMSRPEGLVMKMKSVVPEQDFETAVELISSAPADSAAWCKGTSGFTSDCFASNDLPYILNDTPLRNQVLESLGLAVPTPGECRAAYWFRSCYEFKGLSPLLQCWTDSYYQAATCAPSNGNLAAGKGWTPVLPLPTECGDPCAGPFATVQEDPSIAYPGGCAPNNPNGGLTYRIPGCKLVANDCPPSGRGISEKCTPGCNTCTPGLACPTPKYYSTDGATPTPIEYSPYYNIDGGGPYPFDVSTCINDGGVVNNLVANADLTLG